MIRPASMKLRNPVPERPVVHAAIADPEHHTVMDRGGAVRSIQAANVDIPEAELEALWDPMHLERLARTYWKYLSRVTLGLIRVEYTETEREVVFLRRPFVLLRFGAPEYELTDDRGVVRWTIRDGILVYSTILMMPYARTVPGLWESFLENNFYDLHELAEAAWPTLTGGEAAATLAPVFILGQGFPSVA
jgi:hypothetical protein